MSHTERATRRPATLVVLALAALLSLALAACDKGDAGVGHGLNPPGAAKDELTAAIKALAGKPYRFSVAQGDTPISSGAVDGKGSAQFHATVSDPTSGASVELDAARVDKAAYLKVDFGALAGVVPVLGDLNRKWVKVDAKKLPSSLSKQLDAGLSADLSVLAAGVQTAERNGNVYQGTLDLSKGAALLNTASGGKVDAAAKALPYEATVADGALATLKVKGLKIGTQTADVTLTLTDVGKPITIAKPKGAVSAPADLYSLLAAA
ncbi:hypothetical protein [Luedemannella helvata]|uniref:Lipoprotein n=1 Tax=Luedemannella helvata TaxID=349315 RepID=A0ABP4VQ53_9ACTN